jgi:hypothetical protein
LSLQEIQSRQSSPIARRYNRWQELAEAEKSFAKLLTLKVKITKFAKMFEKSE